MYVSIQQAGDKVSAARIHDQRVFTNGMRGIRADIGNVTLFDRNVGIGHDLAGLDTHPLTIADDQVSGLASHGDVNKSAG